jgi:GDP-L-fucose synthase
MTASLRGGRVFVAGADTVVGRSLVSELRSLEGVDICGPEISDSVLRDRHAVEDTLARLKPTHVIVAAGRAGGIALNRRSPADLMLDNLQVATAIVPAAHAQGVTALLYLASSCTYPRAASQPMQPQALFTGALEPTSAAYATAKLAGIVLCQAYRDQYGAPFVSGIVGDAYGPGDDFDPENSHVVAGLIRRMHEARERGDATFTVWGTGRQVRDLVFVDDLVHACLLALADYHEREPINLSSGIGTTIAELADVVRGVVGFQGELCFDASRPDGAPIKVLDAGAIRRLGFVPRSTLRAGVERTYQWFLRNVTQDALSLRG